MNSYGSGRIGRGTLIVALKCLRDLLKYVIYNKILRSLNLTKVTYSLMLCAQRVLSRSALMYLPSYAVNKGRFSSS